MQFSKQFPITNLALDSFLELGSIEGTIWSCFIAYNVTHGFYRIKIVRSRSDSAVTIDVKVLSSGLTEILFTNGNLVSNGLNQIAFSLNRAETTGMTGYVTVHYNTSKKEEVTQTSNDIWMPQLVNDLLHLLDNPDSFSDATLVCGTSKVPVHKNILSARSPVFAAMFKTQMQEGRDGVVDIVDMEPDVLKAMLKYIYSGKTDHSTNSLVGDLLLAADKYQLDELKFSCVQLLKVNMTADNVFRSLVLGDLHDGSLKTYAVEFICKYKKFSDLEKAEEWQSLMKERPSLALEVTTTAVNYFQKKCLRREHSKHELTER